MRSGAGSGENRAGVLKSGLEVDAVHDRVEDYLDGMLSPGETAAFEEHLRSCAECRLEAERSHRLRALASALPPVEPPPDLVSGVRERIARRRPAGRLSGFAPLLLGAAAAAVVLLASLPPATVPDPSPLPAGGPTPVSRPAVAGVLADLTADVLADFLAQAGNAGPGDAAMLAAEARALGLADLVRRRSAAASGPLRARLSAIGDFLTQLENSPDPAATAAEARLLAVAVLR